MYYLFLDESGDLGFDLRKRGSSNYFVITFLLVKGNRERKALENAVERTIKSKVRKKEEKNEEGDGTERK